MDTIRYIALDVHIASLVVLVMSATGKVLLQDVIPTSVPAIRKFFKALRGKLIVTFEEGTLLHREGYHCYHNLVLGKLQAACLRSPRLLRLNSSVS